MSSATEKTHTSSSATDEAEGAASGGSSQRPRNALPSTSPAIGLPKRPQNTHTQQQQKQQQQPSTAGGVGGTTKREASPSRPIPSNKMISSVPLPIRERGGGVAGTNSLVHPSQANAVGLPSAFLLKPIVGSQTAAVGGWGGAAGAMTAGGQRRANSSNTNNSGVMGGASANSTATSSLPPQPHPSGTADPSVAAMLLRQLQPRTVGTPNMLVRAAVPPRSEALAVGASSAKKDSDSEEEDHNNNNNNNKSINNNNSNLITTASNGIAFSVGDLRGLDPLHPSTFARGIPHAFSPSAFSATTADSSASGSPSNAAPPPPIPLFQHPLALRRGLLPTPNSTSAGAGSGKPLVTPHLRKPRPLPVGSANSPFYVPSASASASASAGALPLLSSSASASALSANSAAMARGLASRFFSGGAASHSPTLQSHTDSYRTTNATDGGGHAGGGTTAGNSYRSHIEEEGARGAAVGPTIALPGESFRQLSAWPASNARTAAGNASATALLSAIGERPGDLTKALLMAEGGGGGGGRAPYGGPSVLSVNLLTANGPLGNGGGVGDDDDDAAWDAVTGVAGDAVLECPLPQSTAHSRAVSPPHLSRGGGGAPSYASAAATSPGSVARRQSRPGAMGRKASYASPGGSGAPQLFHVGTPPQSQGGNANASPNGRRSPAGSFASGPVGLSVGSPPAPFSAPHPSSASGGLLGLLHSATAGKGHQYGGGGLHGASAGSIVGANSSARPHALAQLEQFLAESATRLRFEFPDEHARYTAHPTAATSAVAVGEDAFGFGGGAEGAAFPLARTGSPQPLQFFDDDEAPLNNNPSPADGPPKAPKPRRVLAVRRFDASGAPLVGKAAVRVATTSQSLTSPKDPNTAETAEVDGVEERNNNNNVPEDKEELCWDSPRGRPEEEPSAIGVDGTDVSGGLVKTSSFRRVGPAKTPTNTSAQFISSVRREAAGSSRLRSRAGSRGGPTNSNMSTKARAVTTNRNQSPMSTALVTVPTTSTAVAQMEGIDSAAATGENPLTDRMWDYLGRRLQTRRHAADLFLSLFESYRPALATILDEYENHLGFVLAHSAAEKRHWRSRAASLEKDGATLAAALREEQSKRRDTEAECDALRAQVAVLRNAEAALKEERIVFEHEQHMTALLMRQSEEEKTALTRKMMAHEATIEDLQQQLSEPGKAIERLNAQIVAKNGHIQTLSARNDRLSSENAALKRQSASNVGGGGGGGFTARGVNNSGGGGGLSSSSEDEASKLAIASRRLQETLETMASLKGVVAAQKEKMRIMRAQLDQLLMASGGIGVAIAGPSAAAAGGHHSHPHHPHISAGEYAASFGHRSATPPSANGGGGASNLPAFAVPVASVSDDPLGSVRSRRSSGAALGARTASSHATPPPIATTPTAAGGTSKPVVAGGPSSASRASSVVGGGGGAPRRSSSLRKGAAGRRASTATTVLATPLGTSPNKGKGGNSDTNDSEAVPLLGLGSARPASGQTTGRTEGGGAPTSPTSAVVTTFSTASQSQTAHISGGAFGSLLGGSLPRPFDIAPEDFDELASMYTPRPHHLSADVAAAETTAERMTLAISTIAQLKTELSGQRARVAELLALRSPSLSGQIGAMSDVFSGTCAAYCHPSFQDTVLAFAHPASRWFIAHGDGEGDTKYPYLRAVGRQRNQRFSLGAVKWHIHTFFAQSPPAWRNATGEEGSSGSSPTSANAASGGGTSSSSSSAAVATTTNSAGAFAHRLHRWMDARYPTDGPAMCYSFHSALAWHSTTDADCFLVLAMLDGTLDESHWRRSALAVARLRTEMERLQAQQMVAEDPSIRISTAAAVDQMLSGGEAGADGSPSAAGGGGDAVSSGTFSGGGGPSATAVAPLVSSPAHRPRRRISATFINDNGLPERCLVATPKTVTVENAVKAMTNVFGLWGAESLSELVRALESAVSTAAGAGPTGAASAATRSGLAERFAHRRSLVGPSSSAAVTTTTSTHTQGRSGGGGGSSSTTLVPLGLLFDPVGISGGQMEPYFTSAVRTLWTVEAHTFATDVIECLLERAASAAGRVTPQMVVSAIIEADADCPDHAAHEATERVFAHVRPNGFIIGDDNKDAPMSDRYLKYSDLTIPLAVCVARLRRVGPARHTPRQAYLQHLSSKSSAAANGASHQHAHDAVGGGRALSSLSAPTAAAAATSSLIARGVGSAASASLRGGSRAATPAAEDD